jgi:hypothetical protein
MDDPSRSNVIVIGAGIAGLAATLRLVERGFQVTLLERNKWLGGKLGAHQAGGGGDFHEHSYHMYLNWYHNFWRITEEIGARKHFEPRHSMGYLRRGGGDWAPRLVRTTDVGAPETACQNLMSGLRSPADMFLYSYALIDLLGTPAWHYEALDKMSVLSFLNSRHYLTRAAMSIQEDISLKAFASPNFLTAVQSFRKFISFGYCCPSPMMWLLRGNTQHCLFGPLEHHLRRLGSDGGGGRRLEVRPLHEVRRLCLTEAGAIERIEGVELAASPSPGAGPQPAVKGTFSLPVKGNVILAVPPQSVARLVDEAVFAQAPHLAAVRRMNSQPMISFDLYFKKPFALPNEVVGLLNSRFALSFLDTSRLWRNDPNAATFINVVASDALPISGYSPDMIRRFLIQELMEYLPFTTGDVDFERCHLQTNTTEELFTNEVGSWGLRPATACGIPNLFLAGDYCRNPIDVVTIEGAVTSGLLAAEAVRARAGKGPPIEIIEPNVAPEWILAGLKLACLPSAHLAKAISTIEHWLLGSYRELFPKG